MRGKTSTALFSYYLDQTDGGRNLVAANGCFMACIKWIWPVFRGKVPTSQTYHYN